MPDLTRQETEAPAPGQLGYVTQPPAAVGDPFTVTVPEFSGEHVYQVAYWQPRGDLLPAPGDKVLVVKDEKGEAWVVGWWPAAGPAAEGVGMIVHGDDADAPRLPGFAHRIWVGTVIPLNAIEFDQWIKPE
jgi:hypothetical protein